MRETARTTARLRSGEGGHAILFTAGVLLPFLCLFLAVSIDLACWFGARRRAQVVLDEAARQAHRYLPYRERARRAVEEYTGRYPDIGPGVSAAITSDTIALEFRSLFQPVFAELLLTLTGRPAALSLPLSASAAARGTVLDAFIALDTGRYLAPDVLHGEAWGDAQAWPGAYFFDRLQPIELQGRTLDARLLTQQCFNPAFSALKQAAIQLYDYLSSFRHNAVGLAFYPGEAEDLDLLHDVVPGSRNQTVRFAQYRSRYASNAYCAAAAEREHLAPHYKFPLRHPELPALPSAGAQWLVLPPDWSINDSYLPYITAREAIWSRPAHQTATGDFAEVLAQAAGQLVSAPVFEERGGLMGHSQKAIFVLSGDLPRVRGIRFPAARDQLAARLAWLRNLLEQGRINLRLYYVLLYRDESGRAALAGQAAELRRFFDEQSQPDGKPSRLTVHMLEAAASQGLSTTIAGTLALQGRTALVAR